MINTGGKGCNGGFYGPSDGRTAACMRVGREGACLRSGRGRRGALFVLDIGSGSEGTGGLQGTSDGSAAARMRIGGYESYGR